MANYDNLEAGFTLNGKSYSTDPETLALLRDAVRNAKRSRDSSAVQAIVALGLKSGRIRKQR